MNNLLVVLLLWISACATSPKPASSVEPGHEVPVLTANPTDISIVEKFPSINYSPIISNASEKVFIEQGQQEANTVLKDPCFKEQWLAAKLTENRNFTNAEIYIQFVSHSPLSVGIEMFTGGLKEKLNHTVAYEGNPIRMNRAYVANSTYVASASLHEGFGHGLGFTHYTPKMNPNSIPYILNRVYEYCAKKLGIKVAY